MAYEPPGLPNWYGAPTHSVNSYSHYTPSHDPFGFPFGQQSRPPPVFSDIGSSMQSFGFRDGGYCPPMMASAFHSGAGGLDRIGHLTNVSHGFKAKESPHPETTNESPRYFGDHVRPLAASSRGGGECPRNDVPQSMQYASNLTDMDAIPKSAPAASTPTAESNGSNGARKKRDRFNGMSEDEVLKLTIPDQMCHNLDILIIGISPGMTAAYLGHHYAGPGNHFWKCLYLSGLIPEPMNASEDYKLKEFGIGFTNFVARCSKGSVELTRREVKDGTEILTKKIQKYRPKIAVFNGKGIYEMFCNHKNFYIGKQPEPFPGTDTVVYVMPSSSARCSQLPRASDKVPFFVALRKLRDHVCGRLGRHLDESEVVFPDLDLKVEPRRNRQQPPASSSSVAPPSVTSTTSDQQERKRQHSEDGPTPPGSQPAAKLPCDISQMPWQPHALEPPSWYPHGYPSGMPDFDYVVSRPSAASAAAAASIQSGYRSNFPTSSFGRTDFGSRMPLTDYMSGASSHASALHERFGFSDAGIIPKFPYSNINPYSYEAAMPNYGMGGSMPSSFSLTDNFWPL